MLFVSRSVFYNMIFLDDIKFNQSKLFLFRPIFPDGDLNKIQDPSYYPADTQHNLFNVVLTYKRRRNVGETLYWRSNDVESGNKKNTTPCECYECL